MLVQSWALQGFGKTIWRTGSCWNPRANGFQSRRMKRMSRMKNRRAKARLWILFFSVATHSFDHFGKKLAISATQQICRIHLDLTRGSLWSAGAYLWRLYSTSQDYLLYFPKMVEEFHHMCCKMLDGRWLDTTKSPSRARSQAWRKHSPLVACGVAENQSIEMAVIQQVICASINKNWKQ